jgi:hypothetical protein
MNDTERKQEGSGEQEGANVQPANVQEQTHTNPEQSGALSNLQNQLLGRSVDFGAQPLHTPTKVQPPKHAPIQATNAADLASVIAKKLQSDMSSLGYEDASAAKKSLPPIQKREGILQQARTYRGDVADTVAEHKLTPVDIVSAEQNRKASMPIPAKEKRSPLPIALILSSLLLFLLGATFIGAIIYTFTPSEQEVRIKTLDAPLVFSDSTVSRLVKSADRNTVLQTLLTFRETASPPLGAIERLRLITPESEDLSMSTEDFFSAIEASVEPSFVRALDPRMMIGVYSSEYVAPFLVFTVLSFDQAFAGMLDWEDNITANLSPFLSRKNIYQNETFSDVIIQNKDVRVLRNADGEIAYLYAFPDRRTLIITTYQYAFEELVKRLNNTRKITSE